MTDENKEDEYQFTDLDGNQDFDDSPEADEVKTSFPAENNLKRVILSGLGVIVAGFVLFKFFAPYFLNKEKEEAISVMKSNPPVVVQAMPKQMPVKPVVNQSKTEDFLAQLKEKAKKPIAVSRKPVIDPKVNDTLNALQYSSRVTSKKITSINNNMGGLKEGIDSLASKINTLNFTIVTLSSMVNKQQIMIEQLKPKAKVKKATKKISKPKVTYQIKALIPGRGWLMSSLGVTITVVKGTKIDGYGLVDSIDARHGKVFMSTGKVIQFSVSDT